MEKQIPLEKVLLFKSYHENLSRDVYDSSNNEPLLKVAEKATSSTY